MLPQALMLGSSSEGIQSSRARMRIQAFQVSSPVLFTHDLDSPLPSNVGLLGTPGVPSAPLKRRLYL